MVEIDNQKAVQRLGVFGSRSTCSRPPIALRVSSPGTQTISIPPDLQDYVVSLQIHIPYTTKDDIIAVARLLNSCKNLHHLFITSRNLTGLTARLTQSLPRLRDVDFIVDNGLSSSEFTALLHVMPNLRQAWLPPSLNAFDDQLGPFRFDLLSLQPWHRTALPLLFSGRWRARSVTLCVGALTWQFFERTDWARVRSESHANTDYTVALYLNFLESRDSEGGPAPAVSFIASFRALRRLRLRARGADLRDMLPVVMRCCPGLRLLELYFYGSKQEHAANVANALMDALPGALGSLEVTLSYSEDSLLFNDIRQLCRTHRIRCILAAQAPGRHCP